MSSDPEEFVERVRQRIANEDYEAVFASGCCFEFALRIHERCGYPIFGFRNVRDPKSWGHVWARKSDGHAIDIRGIHDEDLLIAIASERTAQQVESVPVSEVRDFIVQRAFPADLQAKVFALADKILADHERFRDVKLPSPEVAAGNAELCRKIIEQMNSADAAYPASPPEV